MKQKESLKEKTAWKQGDGLAALIERTNVENPLPADIAALHRELSGELGKMLSARDLLQQAQEGFIANMKGGQGTRINLRHVVKQTARRLEQDGDGPLEKMLIAQVVLTQVHLFLLESYYGKIVSNETSQALGAFWDRRITEAHKRHARACEALARVRRLLGSSQSGIRNITPQPAADSSAPAQSKKPYLRSVA